MKLLSTENNLKGCWIFKNSLISKDPITERIEWLITNHLKKIAQDSTGWDILHIDPDDNRYWELTYPQSSMQGGGPPSLTHISEENAKTKYLV